MADYDRVTDFMAREGLDGLIATTIANLNYISGLWDPGLFLFPREAQDYAVIARDDPNKPVLVLNQGDLDLCTNLPHVSDIITYGSFFRYVSKKVDLTSRESQFKERTIGRKGKNNPMDALATALQKAGMDSSRVGLDEQGFNGDLDELKKLLPNLEIEFSSDLFAEIRSVKTPEEIEKLTAAVRVTEEALLEGVGYAEEGISEWEMAREIRKAMVARDAMPTFLLLKFGRRGAIEQLPQRDIYLKEGDTIWVDLGCMLEGYCSDIARTFAYGEPSERARYVYDALLEGENAALNAIRSGVIASEIFEISVNAVRETGIPDYQRHHVGHGIGLETYDPPIIKPSDHTPLETGMVMDIETPYYEIGLGAFHVEDTFVVTEDGAQLLTTISRNLEVIE